MSAQPEKFGTGDFQFEITDHDNLGFVRFSQWAGGGVEYDIDVSMQDLGDVIEFLQKVKDREDALRDEFGF